jgi:uncharacterized membrane protein YgcG
MAQGALAAKWLKGRSRRAPLEPTLTHLDASLRFKSAQPALLYLVPGALGAALLTAAARGEIPVCPAPPPSLLLPLPVSLLYTHKARAAAGFGVRGRARGGGGGGGAGGAGERGGGGGGGGGGGAGARLASSSPPPFPPVLTGHVSSLLPY